jgi:uncharacterized protein
MNQLLDSLTYDADTGSLSLQSVRYMLLSPSILVEIQKGLEGMIGHETQEVFVQSATTEGAILAGRFRDVFGYTPDQVLGAVNFVLSESGWGVVSTDMVNLEGREIVFKMLESPFADAYGPSTQSVCHTALGIFQGVAMTLFDAETSGMEVQCTAKGDTCCRFVVGAK